MTQPTEIPSGWRQRRLRFDVKSNPKKAELDLDPETEVSFVPMDAVGEYGGLRLDTTRAIADVFKDYTYFTDGDVCIARITPCFENGKGALACGLKEGVAFGTTELHVLRPMDGVDRKFLFYITISYDFRGWGEAEMLGAGGQKRVPERFMKDWQAPLPDLDTQRRIAGYLDDKTARIDALIEKKRALLDRLAEKRQALITRAVTRGLNPSAPLKDSGIDWLGKVPAHWEVKKLRRVRKYLTSGSRDWAAHYADEGTPFIRMTNVTKQGVELDLSDLRFVNLDGETEGTRTAIQAGDILITITAELGSVAIARTDVEGAFINQHLALFRTDRDLCEPDFLVNFLSTDVARTQFFVNGQGGTKQGLGFEQVNNVWVAFPPIEEQLRIGEHCAAIWRTYEAVQRPLETSVEKLIEYRAALVTAAVTGKIKALLTDEKPKPAKKEAPATFKRSVLAAYIADALCDHPTFGRVKFQKLLHLCEAHLEIQEVAGNYHRDAAGPFDTQMMQSVHSQIEKQGWITPIRGEKGWTYARGAKVETYRDHFARYFGERKQAIEDLLALIAPMKTQQAEIVSTAFAAWNDLLLEGKSPTDHETVDLILNDWAESKKAITADRWHSALAWMREKGLVPRGMGEHTKRKG